MLPSFATVAEVAKAIGYVDNAGRVWLKRYIERAQVTHQRQILQGVRPLRVNLSELRQLCPELFPTEWHRAAAELRRELRRNRLRERQLADQIEQLTEASYCLYVNLSDRIEQLETTANTGGAMGEGQGLTAPEKPEGPSPKDRANHEPPQTHAS